jgi:hypothetical protein
MESVKEYVMIILIREETQTLIQLEDIKVQVHQIITNLVKVIEIFLLIMLIL